MSDDGTPALNIYQRINEVRKEVFYVKKDSDVGGQFTVVTHDALTRQIRDSLIKHGIITVPRVTAHNSMKTEMMTGKKFPIYRLEQEITIDFVNMDKPEEKVSIPLVVHSLAYDEKAPAKGVSTAVRIAELKLFNIESGDDEEAEIEDTRKTKVTPKAGAGDVLAEDVKLWIRDELAPAVAALHARNDVSGAFEEYQEAKRTLTENDPDDAQERVIYLWSCFGSDTRTAITEHGNKLKAEKKDK